MTVLKHALRVLVSLAIVCQPGLNREALWEWLCYSVFDSPRTLSIYLLPLCTVVMTFSSIAFCFLLYWLELPWVEARRSYPVGTPWPWKHPDAGVREDYARQERKAWQRVLINVSILIPAGILHGYSKEPGSALLMPAAIPSRAVLAAQLYAMMLLKGLYGYLLHRLLHTKHFYRIHKVHHEFKNTTILATYNIHVLEVIAVAVGSLTMFRFLGMHLYGQLLFLIMTQLVSGISEHSGYDVEFWFLPFDAGTDAAIHDVHHRTSFYHNYGFEVMWWDKLLGTYMHATTAIRDTSAAAAHTNDGSHPQKREA